MLSRWEKMNIVYLGLLTLGGIIWIGHLHTFGICMGLAAIVIAYFLYCQNRWAYFAAAVWCFGLLRIAMDDGHQFHTFYPSVLKVVYLVGLIAALVLHEKVAKKKPASESS